MKDISLPWFIQLWLAFPKIPRAIRALIFRWSSGNLVSATIWDTFFARLLEPWCNRCVTRVLHATRRYWENSECNIDNAQHAIPQVVPAMHWNNGGGTDCYAKSMRNTIASNSKTIVCSPCGDCSVAVRRKLAFASLKILQGKALNIGQSATTSCTSKPEVYWLNFILKLGILSLSRHSLQCSLHNSTL